MCLNNIYKQKHTHSAARDNWIIILCVRNSELKSFHPSHSEGKHKQVFQTYIKQPEKNPPWCKGIFCRRLKHGCSIKNKRIAQKSEQSGEQLRDGLALFKLRMEPTQMGWDRGKADEWLIYHREEASQKKSHFKPPAEKRRERRQICRHSACSLDLVHILSLSDGPMKKRAIWGRAGTTLQSRVAVQEGERLRLKRET